MTDFEKIKAYYSVLDEQHRLEKPDGRLEFEISKRIILQYLNKSDHILDLGGGAGKYSIELAKLGYNVTLADLSERLLEQAKTYIQENDLPPLQSYDVVNAIDLSRYDDNSFDVIILFGPLYHLLESDERNKCVSEVYRVLRPNGIVFASFIPYLSGAVGVVSRASYFPQQVNEDNLSEVFRTGRFNNNANVGFQEGYYPESKEIVQLFKKHNFTQILLRSIRSFGYNREEKLYELSEKNSSLFNKIIELIDTTSTNPAIIETCGHALYVGRKFKVGF
jgi:2-polyprenyl-3-methyl-5-hydroxy-6-metoxy-1,4-benzoquinol methylase